MHPSPIWTLAAVLCLMLLAANTGVVEGVQCRLQAGSFCKCDLMDGTGTLDLTAISKSGGKPYFENIPGASSWHYDYDPCVAFTNKKCINNCLVCQGGDATCGRNTAIDIEVLSRNPDKGVLTYGNGDVLKKKARISVVSFTCDQSQEAELKFTAENPAGSYNFALTSKHTCVQAPPHTQPPHTQPPHTQPPPPGPTTQHQRRQTEHNSVSLGTILSICSLCAGIVYLTGGYTYMFVRRGARGREAVPNRVFWMELPWLIKDGLMFIVGKARSIRGGYSEVK